MFLFVVKSAAVKHLRFMQLPTKNKRHACLRRIEPFNESVHKQAVLPVCRFVELLNGCLNFRGYTLFTWVTWKKPVLTDVPLLSGFLYRVQNL